MSPLPRHHPLTTAAKLQSEAAFAERLASWNWKAAWRRRHWHPLVSEISEQNAMAFETDVRDYRATAADLRSAWQEGVR